MLKLLGELLALLFKKNVPSSIIVQANPNDVLVHEAQNWVGTKEVGENSGPEVEMFQRALNSKPNKEAWCADFVIFCVQQVEKKLGTKSLIYRSENAQELYKKSPDSIKRSVPSPGNVVIWQFGNGTLGHAGIVEAIAKDGYMTTIEGNTGEGTGVIREGDGVYRRTRKQQGNLAMHIIGYIQVF